MTIQLPSKNFTVLPNRKIVGVCVHIGEGTLQAVLNWLRNPISNVSSHYVVAKDGTEYQLVQEENVAWTEGVVTQPSWVLYVPGTNPNEYLISIEHEGLSTDIWPLAQKQTTAARIRAAALKYGFPIDRNHVIGHYEVDRLNRPNCPAVDKSILDELVAMASVDPTIRNNPNRVATPQEESYYKQVIINLINRILSILKGRLNNQ